MSELALRIGVTRQTVWNWEQGRHVPTSPALVRLAKWAGVPASFFFREVDDGEEEDFSVDD
jgi:transcriptional regulator with XRE-family HTH domain